jgi:hypothetical protein
MRSASITIEEEIITAFSAQMQVSSGINIYGSQQMTLTERQLVGNFWKQCGWRLHDWKEFIGPLLAETRIICHSLPQEILLKPQAG